MSVLLFLVSMECMSLSMATKDVLVVRPFQKFNCYWVIDSWRRSYKIVTSIYKKTYSDSKHRHWIYGAWHEILGSQRMPWLTPQIKIINPVFGRLCVQVNLSFTSITAVSLQLSSYLNIISYEKLFGCDCGTPTPTPTVPMSAQVVLHNSEAHSGPTGRLVPGYNTRYRFGT